MLRCDENKLIKSNLTYETTILSYEIKRSEIQANQRLYRIAKRLFDILFSIAGILLLSPAMLLVAIAIWLDDPKAGPIYISKRCGRDGEQFRFYKFRSMCADAEAKQGNLYELNEADGPVFKIKDDPRITRIGKLIRKVNIDELPQLFNVLLGHMSIVGPRPPIPREVEAYNEYQMQRLSVTPGLTCYWQVQHQRNSLSFDEWVDLDIRYIEQRSFLLDMKLILKTIGVVFRGEGQ